MCDLTKYKENLDRLNDYLEYVNSDMDRLMAYEPELYAAYLTLRPELVLEEVKEWYEEAEAMYISAHGIDLYLMKKYDVWRDEDLDYYYEKEVHRDGLVRECGSYWFLCDN